MRFRYGKEVKMTYLELRNEGIKLSRHRKKNNSQVKNSRETVTVRQKQMGRILKICVMRNWKCLW